MLVMLSFFVRIAFTCRSKEKMGRLGVSLILLLPIW